VFEKGWDALLRVKRAEGTELTLISGPLWNPLPKLSKTKTPSPPALQLFTKSVKPKEGQTTFEEVIWKMTLAVDGRVIDLNRIRIPSGIKIVDRRRLPDKTKGSASAAPSSPWEISRSMPTTTRARSRWRPAGYRSCRWR